MTKRPTILVVYKCLGYPLRATAREHLYSFRNFSDANVFHIKLDHGMNGYYSEAKIPEYLAGIEFDVIVFHYGFISSRWGGKEMYERAKRQVEPLLNNAAIKVLMPQDEYMNSAAMVDFIHSFRIDIVFSVSPESEWSKIYPGVDPSRVKFKKVLTGYLDEHTVSWINEHVPGIEKDIDIGYRARNLPAWLGRHGYMKTTIAEAFKASESGSGLKMDISTDPSDTFFGMDWYRYMIRCKYMIGVEGGATVLDADGSIATKSKLYLEKFPAASFEEIEANCFPGLDGKLKLFAISPRHLEACVTRTCQILVEGEYNGILKPWRHYIPLKEDFSNLEQVLKLVKEDKLRKEITENAWHDIVGSGNYSYKKFTKVVLNESLRPLTQRSVANSRLQALLRRNRRLDRYYWFQEWYLRKIYNPYIFGKRRIRMGMILFIKGVGLKRPAKWLYNIIKGKTNSA